MLALVKEPRIEMSLTGSKDKIAEMLCILRKHYTVDILSGETKTKTHESVDVFESDIWEGTTPGELLASFRLKHEMTQEDLAEKSGIHQAVISAYETGKRPLSKRAAVKLGKAMNESPDKFFRHTK